MRLAWLRQIKTHSVFMVSVFVAGNSLFLGQAAAEIPWRGELTTAHAEAKAQNKALLLHFYSDNCVWCDRLEAGAFQSPDVAAAVAGGFVPVKIHAGQSPELAKMFKVTKFPTDVVVTPAGKTLAHSVSPQDPNRYIAMLAQAGNQMIAAQSAPTTPTMQPGQTQAQLASAPTQPAARPQMPVNAAGSFAMQQVPSNGQMPAHPPTANPHAGMPLPGGATARLAGARTDGMSLGMPAQMTDPVADISSPATEQLGVTEEPTPASASQPSPKLAMEGYCAVTVIDEDKWVEGNPKFGVVHLGKLYLFSSAEKMETFLADPMPYTPVLNEIDVVRFFEERQIVPGKRRFGMRDPIHQRMFFFADEAAMNHFFNEYERYTDAAIEVMSQAVEDANPDAS
ncbi:protein disulfide-isomerase [Rhodopirellula rubra]|uniref:Protein disulfide-isomerase n=1 Tax=Aporhodopirellula rubra TaxID=980271 RepID=A0A7W5E0K9_9BACT|nr:protein disulfide-isomerase [Aporhodopirellula rubra]